MTAALSRTGGGPVKCSKVDVGPSGPGHPPGAQEENPLRGARGQQEVWCMRQEVGCEAGGKGERDEARLSSAISSPSVVSLRSVALFLRLLIWRSRLLPSGAASLSVGHGGRLSEELARVGDRLPGFTDSSGCLQ